MPAQNVLGQVGAGFATAMQTLDIGRCGLGASSLGEVEVLDGLAEGERVVVSGSDLFERAEKVRINR